MLETLQQTEAPVVVAQGIVDAAFAFGILGSIYITQDAVFAFLEDLFQFILMDIAYHVGIGFMGDEDALGVGETTGGIGLDDGLHGRLGVDLIAIVDLLHVKTRLTLYGDGDFTDQVVESRLGGLGVGGAATFAPDVVVVGLDAGHLV